MYKEEHANKLLEQRRDVSKYVEKSGVEIALVGIENQEKADSDMVFRVMGYDYTSYRSQISSKCERRYPVISAVLYFGRTPWEQPCTIKQAVEIPEGYEQAVSDYKIHVVDVPRIPREIREQLTSDFRAVADFFANRERPDYMPDKQELMHAEAVLQLLKVFTKDKRYARIEAGIREKIQEGVSVSMCDFAERMERQGIEQGIEQGIKALVETCAELNVPREEIQDKLTQKFELTMDEAKEYMERYYIQPE